MYIIKIVIIFSLNILIIACSSDERSFKLSEIVNHIVLSDTIFVLQQLGVDHRVDEEDSVSSIWIRTEDASHSTYVVNRFIQAKERLLNRDDANMLSNIGIMQGVLNHRYERFDDVVNFSLVVERNTDRANLLSTIESMMAHQGVNKVNFSVVEFDEVQQIQRFSYEYFSQVRGDKNE